MTWACRECRQENCAPLFRNLSQEDFAALRAQMLTVHYSKGDLIFQEGSLASGIYIVCQGLVKYGKYSEDRTKRRIFKIVSPPQTLGEEALLEERPCVGFAAALTDCTVAFVERRALLQFITARPAVLLSLCKKFSQELMVFQCKLVEASYEPLERSIARLLLYLVSRYGHTERSGARVLELELSRSDLAEMAGVSMETAIRVLTRLKEHGILDFDHRIIRVLDTEALEERASPLPPCVTADAT
ncbi:MAG: Crp/Fnr family transcriptional regulator [Candidatus Bipolaricaulota bacterium]|nr:Crp/Fnr family transcriptional regulator [Candidatus Bipolaricaulota bacterium]MCS7274816.1 Crp/Fnr family transcriptional regulator [Candidatus Bipolaricaulota bacterium]MDW8111237.1 Crp/Fnr family transcriptional regulator [Candidatus Bipolaricaulota bacterium]MDW8328627.1 Crp/Fnr family transcriptional regulator [Candidatus Bipolaricaulota bacterium]